MHAFAVADFHEADHLFDLTFADAVTQAVVHAHDFGCHDAAIAVCACDESLGDDGLQDARQLGDDLLLLVVWEDVDESVDTLWGVDCVQGCDDEVAGFCGCQGDTDGFEVAQF